MKPSPELIDAIRRCAAKRMSITTTADELTTRLYPLTRNMIIRYARTHEIQFNSDRRRVGKLPRKPRDRRTIPARLPEKPRPSFVTVSVRNAVRSPLPNCSWHGCTRDAEEGDMFCSGHGRKGLIG